LIAVILEYDVKCLTLRQVSQLMKNHWCVVVLVMFSKILNNNNNNNIMKYVLELPVQIYQAYNFIISKYWITEILYKYPVIIAQL